MKNLERLTIARLTVAHEVAVAEARFDDAVAISKILAADRIAHRAAARRWRGDPDQLDLEDEADAQCVLPQALL